MASLSFGRSEALNNLGAKFGTLSLVYREFGQKLIHRLESNDGLQTSLVIDGPNGSGKSFTLRQILEHFKKNTEHFIVEIPSAADWVIGKYPYQRAGDKWEQPFLNTLFFKGLLEKNQIHADKFRIKEAYDLSTQKFQKETPISELLYFGSKNIDKSSEIVKLFFLECKKEKNVLVTVDKLNALYSYSCYFTEESKKIHSSDFLLSREILSLFHTPSYAKVIGASTKSNQDFRDPVKGVAVEMVPPLTKSEIKEFLTMYQKDMVSFRDENVDRLKMLSGGNPRKLYALCRNPLEL